LSLVPTPGADGGYDLTIPADPGVALPGYWMLFAMDAKGVPSIAKTIRIG
jgi:galactose oxidase